MGGLAYGTPRNAYSGRPEKKVSVTVPDSSPDSTRKVGLVSCAEHSRWRPIAKKHAIKNHVATMVHGRWRRDGKRGNENGTPCCWEPWSITIRTGVNKNGGDDSLGNFGGNRRDRGLYRHWRSMALEQIECLIDTWPKVGSNQRPHEWLIPWALDTGFGAVRTGFVVCTKNRRVICIFGGSRK